MKAGRTPKAKMVPSTTSIQLSFVSISVIGPHQASKKEKADQRKLD
jgi:hypothetical protein